MDAHPGHIKKISTDNRFTYFQRLQEFPEIPENPLVFQKSMKGWQVGIFLCGLSRYAQMLFKEKKLAKNTLWF